MLEKIKNKTIKFLINFFHLIPPNQIMLDKLINKMARLMIMFHLISP